MNYGVLFIPLFLLGAGTAIIAQSFEGLIRVVPADPAMTGLTIHSKGPQSLIEIDGLDVPIRILNDRLTEQVVLLLDDFDGENWAVKIDPNELLSMAEESAGRQAFGAPLQLEETREEKTIRGYRCKKWKATNKEMSIEAWITEEADFRLSEFLPKGYEELVVDKNLLIARQLAEKGFILDYRATYRKGPGGYAFRVDLQRQAVSDDLFRYSPERYRELDLVQALEQAQEDPEKMQEVMLLMNNF